MRNKSACVYCGEGYTYEEGWWTAKVVRTLYPRTLHPPSQGHQCSKCKMAIIKINEDEDGKRVEKWKRKRDKILKDLEELKKLNVRRSKWKNKQT